MGPVGLLKYQGADRMEVIQSCKGFSGPKESWGFMATKCGRVRGNAWGDEFVAVTAGSSIEQIEHPNGEQEAIIALVLHSPERSSCRDVYNRAITTARLKL